MDFYEIMLQQKLAGGGGGGDVSIELLSVTENGTYTAPTGYAYSPVKVSVPTGVFPSGTSSITANGIYDITNFASIDVNVPASGGVTADDIAMRTISGVVGGSATSIKNYAFAFCSDITEANFPEATAIGMYAFSSCTGLTKISIPKASFINDNGFNRCTKIKSVNFPSVSSIGASAFGTCTALEEVSFPKATSIANNAFAFCSALKTVSFPEVLTVSPSAFSSCANLEAVFFPKVSYIGSSAFKTCSKLMSLYVLSTSAASLGASALHGTPMSNSTYTGAFGSIYVPASLVSAYQSKANWSVYSARITAYEE